MNNEFIEANMGLVHLCVKRFVGRNVDYEDLVQIGSVGLLKAAKNFDESRGLKFSTYAVPVIIGEIKGYFRSDGIVKVSRKLKELSMKINAVIEKNSRESGLIPTVSQIAEILGESEEQVAQAMCSSTSAISLTMQNEDGETQLSIPVESKEEEIVNRIGLQQIIAVLPEKDRNLINLRYYKNRTQQETAKILGCSQVQISRREKKILLILRQQLG